MLTVHSFMVKSCVWVGGGLIDYTVSYLGQIIVIARSRPRSLTIVYVPFSTIGTPSKKKLHI